MQEHIHRGITPLVAGPPPERASSALVLIHGRGASPESMVTLADALVADSTAVVLPRARQNVWYPRRFIEPIAGNEPYLSDALAMIGDTIAGLMDSGIPMERIVLGGFSQGACLASEYAARNPQRYGGILVFSGGLIGPMEMEFSYDGDLAGTPVFIGCSDTDAHIPIERVDTTATVLAELGGRVEKRIYPGMAHTINEEEIDRSRAIVTAASSRKE